MLFYVICMGFGLVFIIICLVLGQFAGGTDAHVGGDMGSDVGTGGHAESGFDHSGVPGLSFSNPMIIATFVAAFGGFGTVLSSIEATKSVWISAPASAAGAMSIAYAVLMLINRFLNKVQGSSEGQVARLVGQEANIITPIPENGVGEISYTQGGTRYSAPARTAAGTAVAAGRLVKITRVVGSQFYVEPIQ
jgi:membrane protein implicated in regulation of membrane protease activity